ncbi:ABC transporter permease [Corynebacterium callunae]|uniref:ABC transporter permease n=1 Tax=Corynebacterium callunae TaxID=1721 RepID=UPI0039823013
MTTQTPQLNTPSKPVPVVAAAAVAPIKKAAASAVEGGVDKQKSVFKTSSRWERLRGSAFTSPTVILAVLWLLVVLIWTLVPGWVTSGDPISGEVSQKLLPPNGEHWFGTDQLGRDIFTRVVYGTGLTIKAVLVAVSLGFAVGGFLGALAGFIGGWVDALIMRIADVLLAIPSLLLSLAVIVALGFGTINVAIAVGIGAVASISRVMRSEVLKVRNNLYVEAAVASGATKWRVLWRHILPNSLGPVIVLVVLEFGTAVLAISSLSFLGYGAPPPAPEWGALVSQGRDYLAAQGWISAFPGLVIMLTVLSVNRLSNALNEHGSRS